MTNSLFKLSLISAGLVSMITFSSCTSIVIETGTSLLSLGNDTESGYDFSYDKTAMQPISTPIYDAKFLQGIHHSFYLESQDELEKQKLSNELTKAYENGDYVKIDALFKDARDTLSRFPNGTFKLKFLYHTLQDLLYKTGQNDDSAVTRIFNEWSRKTPQSLTPWVAYAGFFINKGGEIRGTDFAKNTSREKMVMHHEYMRKAKRAIKNAEALHLEDPYLYIYKFHDAMDMDFPSAEIEADFKKATTLYPDFTPLYRAMAGLLLPRWRGDSDDLRKFPYWAMTVPKHKTDPLLIYASIAESLLENQLMTPEEFLSYDLNWSYIQNGYVKMAQQNQLTHRQIGYFCWMANAYHDKPTARILYPQFQAEDHPYRIDLLEARESVFLP